jgi:ABC-type lipoprotein export system ATPase subunit/GNAT superfamily N-acetyltransferase
METMQMKRREYFRITGYARRYDSDSGKFIINIGFKTAAPKSSERVQGVAEGFGLGLDEWEKFVILDHAEFKIGASDIVYITGDSGSGKSVLLKALEKDIKHDMGLSCINIADIQPEPNKPLIETVGKTLEEALELLSKVGLNDAFLFLRTFEQLSDGQKYRYKISKMIESRAQFWIMDEFAATLDRDTAKIVAYNLQKLARQQGKAVLAATTHKDLFEDFSPSVHIHKRFGKEITVNYYQNEPAKECSLIREMTIEQGTTKDWQALADFHYRSHKIAAPRQIFCLKRGEELCGVIVYTYPGAAASGRRLVMPRMGMHELNRRVSQISRVVVHPKYRTIGLGVKLVQETLPLCGTEYVEMSAVMAKYNPFAEKAGMTKVLEQQPSKQALEMAKVLKSYGFQPELLGSFSYILNKLRQVKSEQILGIKKAFIENDHPRFRKVFSGILPYGRSPEYVANIENAGLQRLAQLVKICGFLLQTKVYLFWHAG